MNILNCLLLYRRKFGKKKVLFCKIYIYIFFLNLFDYLVYIISIVFSIYICNNLFILVDLFFCFIIFMFVLFFFMFFSIKGNFLFVLSCVIGINMGFFKS